MGGGQDWRFIDAAIHRELEKGVVAVLGVSSAESRGG